MINLKVLSTAAAMALVLPTGGADRKLRPKSSVSAGGGGAWAGHANGGGGARMGGGAPGGAHLRRRRRRGSSRSLRWRRRRSCQFARSAARRLGGVIAAATRGGLSPRWRRLHSRRGRRCRDWRRARVAELRLLRRPGYYGGRATTTTSTTMTAPLRWRRSGGRRWRGLLHADLSVLRSASGTYLGYDGLRHACP